MRRSANTSRRRSRNCPSVTSCLLIDSRRVAEYSTTIWSSRTGDAAFCVSDGTEASSPFCVSGSAAMKITSSTSSTSIIGVMFMSAVARGTGGRVTGAWRGLA